jgi:type IV pilus assembly protein PilC
MILFVLALLLTKVMPIFSNVYSQLGGTMSGFAAALTDFGRSISGAWLWILVVIAALALAAVILSKIQRVRGYFAGFFENLAFSAGLSKAAARARFSSVMAMGLAAGLDFDRSLELSETVVSDEKTFAKITSCREKIRNGEGTAKALAEAGIFTNVQAQMLAVGLRTGSTDSVMRELASKTSAELAELTDIRLSKIEPTLVIIMSTL